LAAPNPAFTGGLFVIEAHTYWDGLISTGRRHVALHIVRCYARHLVASPYRRGLNNARPASLASRWLGRHAAAALDTWVEGFLKANASVAGVHPDQQSGSLAVRYIRLMAAMNKEFEHRLATGKALALQEVLRDPIVRRYHDEWESWSRHEALASEVVQFMKLTDFVDDYTEYVTVALSPGFESDPQLQLTSIRLDSGGYLARLARLLAEAHELQVEPYALGQCFNLGLAAKFADELADLGTDRAEGRYNLLLALLHDRPSERRAVSERLCRGGAMAVDWWRAEAPGAFS
jgi:hypothetical protein